MQCISLPVKDSVIIQHPRYKDHRGFLQELYNTEKYPENVRQFFPVQQVTTAYSTKDVIRGLHFSPYAKLLSCLNGSVYDVVVDLRPDSPTYLKWAGAVLTGTNCRQLFIPPHCGHGYFVLEPDTTVVYCQGGCFRPEFDKGISPLDKLVDVRWSLNDSDNFVLSDKDKAAQIWSDVRPDTLAIPQSRQRVLIIGINSQTGWAMSDVLERDGHYSIYGTTNSLDHPYSMKLDMAAAASDPGQAELVITACRPHIVVICSAFSHVDGCETNPEKSETINAKGTLAIAVAAKTVGAKVIFISSNYVFDENKFETNKSGDYLIGDRGLKEDQTATPLNVYGRHKLRTEGEILKMSATNVVVRISHVYGPSVAGRTNNFVHQMSRAFRNKSKYICSTTELVVPTYTYDIARAIKLFIEKGASGIYHVCGPEAFSKYEWAMRVGRLLNLSSETIEALDGKMKSSTERPQAAVMCTVKYRSLSKEARFRTFEDAMTHWRDSGRGEPL